MSKKSIDTYSSSRSPIKNKQKMRLDLERIRELSRPRAKIDTEEELVGPFTYNPKDSYLSTVSKSPSVAIGRSERFIKVKVREMKNYANLYQEFDEKALMKYNAFVSVNLPRFNFKKAIGHNLVLVSNPDFPGVGRYSPPPNYQNPSYSFSKAKKTFNWKKGKTQIASRGWLL